MDVTFYEVFREEEEALVRYLAKRIRAEFRRGTIQAERPRKNPPAKLISARTQSIIPAEWAEKLSGILTRSTGFDHMQAFWQRAGRKVPVGYLPTYCARSVAEHAFMAMLALKRNVKRQLKQFETFSRSGLTGSECFEQNLLVVGVGNIGREIVALGRAIGMHVAGHDVVKRLPDLEYVSLERGIPPADVIVCALPLTHLTAGMLDYGRLRRAKPGALFLNISRGEISPVRDLRKLLEENILGGIALDIYEDEPLLSEYLRAGKGRLTQSARDVLRLRNAENVLFTPHNAFNTREALERKARQSAEAVEHFLKSGGFPHEVPPAEAS